MATHDLARCGICGTVRAFVSNAQRGRQGWKAYWIRGDMHRDWAIFLLCDGCFDAPYRGFVDAVERIVGPVAQVQDYRSSKIRPLRGRMC